MIVLNLVCDIMCIFHLFSDRRGKICRPSETVLVRCKQYEDLKSVSSVSRDRKRSCSHPRLPILLCYFRTRNWDFGAMRLCSDGGSALWLRLSLVSDGHYCPLVTTRALMDGSRLCLFSFQTRNPFGRFCFKNLTLLPSSGICLVKRRTNDQWILSYVLDYQPGTCEWQISLAEHMELDLVEGDQSHQFIVITHSVILRLLLLCGSDYRVWCHNGYP